MLLAIQSLASLRDGYRFLRFLRESRAKPPGNYAPLAAVILPIKGREPDLELNLSRYLTQDYPNYQLVFVVASVKDPAHSAVSSVLERMKHQGAASAPRVIPAKAGIQRESFEGCGGSESRFTPRAALVVAGYSEARGEKVNNLLCGLEAADPRAEALVFADADARPGLDWLRSLVAPLADENVTVSTGFRWYLPRKGFVSQLRAAWDTSIATLLGDHPHNFAWGGSMAIRAADFKRLEVAERYWARTVSDDYALTRAVREAHGKIRFEPRCLVASAEESSLREFLSWSNRQIILTRVYAARLWRLGLAAHGVYCGTFLFGIFALILPDSSATARAAVTATLLGILLLGIAKGRLRAIVAREVFPEEIASRLRWAARYWQLAPLVPWVMLFNFVVAGFARRIEWRGTLYDLRSASEVRVLRRDD